MVSGTPEPGQPPRRPRLFIHIDAIATLKELLAGPEHRTDLFEQLPTITTETLRAATPVRIFQWENR